MSPRHHPSDDILTGYAAGALEPGFGLVVGAHLDVCAHCRSRVGAFEAASGEALSDLAEADVSANALTNVMSRLGDQAPRTSTDTRPFIERLSLKKKRWVAPGVWVAGVDTPHAPAGSRRGTYIRARCFALCSRGHTAMSWASSPPGILRRPTAISITSLWWRVTRRAFACSRPRAG